MLQFLFKLTFLISISFSAQSDVEEFIQPTIDGIRVDWCLTWGKDCGEPVAYKWCINHGYSKPIYFEVERSIGLTSPTTMLSSRDTCYKEYCGGFRTIVCYKSAN